MGKTDVTLAFPKTRGRELDWAGTSEITQGSGAASGNKRFYGLSPVFQVPAAANNAPTFTTTALSAKENQTTAGTVVATDEDTDDSVTGYTLSGGADQNLFSITTAGVLTFKTAPDFENPADVASTTPPNDAGNNEYIVEVTATSGTGGRVKTTAQVITVTVTDVVTETTCDALWCADITVGNIATSYGYFTAGGTTYGALSDTTVEVGMSTYTVNRIFYAGSSLAISVATRPPSTDTDTWTLYLDNSPFEFTDANYRSDANTDGHQFSWNNHGQTWTSGTVAAKIVAATNNPPSFTSNAAFSVAENTAAVGTVTATDDDTDDSIESYALSGGVDKDLFEIGATTGVLTFKTAPDYENPADVESTTPSNAAGNNEYIVEVTATSGTGVRVKTTAQVITVMVTNVATEPNQAATGSPTIEGTLRVGQTLTAKTDLIRDGNGLSSPGWTYQWRRASTAAGTFADIAGATSSTYELVDADLDQYIRVRVDFTDDDSNAETSTSDSSGPVGAAVTATLDRTLDLRTSPEGQFDIPLDTAGPEEFYMSVTWSERVTGFEAADLRVGNGTPTQINCQGVTLCGIAIQPDAGFDGTLTVQMPANVVNEGNRASNVMEFTIDQTGPTATTYATDAPEPLTGRFDLDIIFDEGVVYRSSELEMSGSDWYGLDVDSIVMVRLDTDAQVSQDVVPGTSELNPVGSTETLGNGHAFRTWRRAGFVPPGDYEGQIAVRIPASERPIENVRRAPADVYGNPVEAAELILRVDTKAPQLETATVDGATMELTWHEELDTSSEPAAGQFTLFEGASDTTGRAATGITLSGKVVTLTFDTPVSAGSAVFVTYVKPSTNPLQDAVGNKAGGLGRERVTNETSAPSVSIADAVASESAGTIDFSVTLSAAHGQDVAVTWTASNGTATEGTHYTGTTGTLTIETGESHGTLSLQVADDTVNNEARTFTVTLSNPTGGATLDADRTSATGTILDDEGSGQQDIDIWIEDGAQVESDSDGMMQFEVKLSETYPWRDVSVDYTTSPGTATAGEDYTHTSGTLTFEAREGCCDPIEIPIIDDSDDEEKTETFTVTLSDPQGASLTGASATGTIYDDDVDDTGIELHIHVESYYLNDDGTVRLDDDGKFTVLFIFQHPELPFSGIAVTGFDEHDVATTGNASFRFIPPTNTSTAAGITGAFHKMEVTPNDRASFDATISVAAGAAHGTDETAQGRGDYSSTGNEAASLRVQNGKEVPVSLRSQAGIDVVITAPGPKKQRRVARDADGGFDVDISFVDPTQPVVGIPVTDFTPGDVEVTGGRAAKEFSSESYQGAAYRLRIIPDRGADEVTVTVPTGVAEAKDDASNINAEGSETFELARREALTARFEGLPATHDGGSFSFRVAFSDDVDAGADEMRDHALEVSGGGVTDAGRVNGADDLWRFTVAPSGGDDVEIELPGGRECAAAGAICTADGRQLSAGLLGLVAGPPPLTAAFTSVPEEHDGTGAFDFRVEFSEDIGNSYVTLRDEAFPVTAGGVTGAHRVDGRNDLWEITVRPDSREEITITLPGGRDCGAAGAVCTAGDHPRPLTNSPSATVAGPPPEPLTASFDDVPAEHPGERFTFGLTLSEEPHGLSYTTLRDHAFAVSGGTVYSASRRQQGTNRLWTIHIDPSGRGAVTVRLPETTDCNASGAICTEDGRPLSHALSATVIGPAGLSVADAEAEENTDETIDFTVTLDRAASGTVRVDYATSDGSATAGADYTAASGTLTFAAGERTKTVAVELLDDTHDEGEETLTLALSNASGAVIVDGEATGTIENHDPMPRALLARFGRAAAQHVVEHVEERIAAPREPGFQGRFAGRELRRGMERDMAAGFLGQLWGAGGANVGGTGVHDPMSGSAGAGAAPLGTPGLAGGAAMGMAASAGPMGGGMGAAAMGAGAGPGGMSAGMVPGALDAGAGAGAMDAGAGPLGGLNRRRLFQMGFGGGDVLTGSAFELNRQTRHGGVLSFWSRGAQSSFHGREGALALNGQVRTTMVGADYAKDRLVAGLSLARSQSLGEYRAETAGQVQSAVTGLYPWLGYRLTDRVSVWGVTGYGSGGLLLTPGSGAALQSDLSMAMTAGGTRGELVAGGAGGFALAFKADALWVGTSIDGTDGPEGRLKATGAAVTRLRTGLEGSRDYTLGDVLSLKPLVEVGLRHDGGDAETGAGMDVGGGVTVSAPAAGLSVDLRVRMLLVHQAEGFQDRGMSMTLSYNPRPSTPLGLAARVAPSWGGQAMGGAEALWGRETMAGMANGGVAAGNRLDGEVGYGLPLGSRFVGTPRVGFGTSQHGRDYRLGYGLSVLEAGAMQFEVGVEAQRRESPMQEGTDHGVLGRATLGW